jgi:hypothetical protein
VEADARTRQYIDHRRGPRDAEGEAVGLEYASSGERNHDFHSNAFSCGLDE